MLHRKATYNTFATQTPGPYDPLAAGAGPPKACIIATHVLSFHRLNDASIRPKCTLTLSILYRSIVEGSKMIRSVPTHVDGGGFCDFGTSPLIMLVDNSKQFYKEGSSKRKHQESHKEARST